MYEETLGRPASAPETKMLEAGFGPGLAYGDKVRLKHPVALVQAKEGKIDGVVLFAIPLLPGYPGRRLAWGYRIEGMDEYVPQEVLQPITE